MDFFDKQARASKKTKWLVCYFLLAVAGIILTLQIVLALIIGLPVTDPELFLMVSVGVVALVALGSIVKSIELSQGGRAVAAMLGGTPVDMNSREPAEQRDLEERVRDHAADTGRQPERLAEAV